MMQNLYHVPNVLGKCPAFIKAHVPGSKSITNRALLIAALADGKSRLKGALFSDDSRYFLKSLQNLGFDVQGDEKTQEIVVNGLGGKIPDKNAQIDVGSAGTAARFLAAMLGVSQGHFHIDASEQMQKRPMQSLFTALKSLGAEIHFLGEEGFLPVEIGNPGMAGARGEVTIDIEKSSQFLSALLIVSPLFQEGLTIHVQGTHGMAYIEMTIKMMEQFGVHVTKEGNTFFTAPGQDYHAGEYQIEPDISAACYFYAMAPLLHSSVVVEHVHTPSLQGDLAFLSVLEEMGAVRTEEEQGIVLKGTGKMQGIEADLSACSDQTMTLAAIAPFAEGPTKITGIGHIRYQESNRLQAVRTELTRMGVLCEEIENGLQIWPGQPHACEIETYEDHRIAMGFSLTGLMADGIVIKNPGCCAKTFAHYFDELEHILGVR